MFITKMSLPRRTFLKGVGATVALPLLDAMVPASTLLAQTPAEFQHDDDTWCDLVAFLGAKPEGLQLAIEFRNASWHTPEVIDLLRHHNVAVAWTEWRDLPRLTDITAELRVARDELKVLDEQLQHFTDEAGTRGVLLHDADVHRPSVEEAGTRDAFLKRALQVGVWPRHADVMLPSVEVTRYHLKIGSKAGEATVP